MTVIQTPIDIYTDGGCQKNPGGPGSSAAVFVDPRTNRNLYQFSYGWKETTNNRAELLAIILSGALSKEFGFNVNRIITDSTYCQGCGVLGWKRKKNADLWVVYDRHCGDINLEWVKGHAGNQWNDVADKLTRRPCFTLDDDMWFPELENIIRNESRFLMAH